MSLHAPSGHFYTVEEYLRLEAESAEKHEYWNGRIVPLSEPLAMAGGSVFHSRIITNVITALSKRLENSPCQVFDSNLRVRIPRKQLFVYPDATVVCGEPQIDNDRTAGETVTNPRVIVEVLSPSSQARDMGDKLREYIDMPSLEEYVIVFQDQPYVHTLLRQDDGTWSMAFCGEVNGSIKIRCLGIEIPLSEIYGGITFPKPQAPSI